MPTIETLLAVAEETKESALELLLEEEKKGITKVFLNYDEGAREEENTIYYVSFRDFPACAEINNGMYIVRVPITNEGRIVYFEFTYDNPRSKNYDVRIVARVRPPDYLQFIRLGFLNLIARSTCVPVENRIPGIEKIINALDRKAKERNIQGEYIMLRPSGEAIVPITDETKRIELDSLLKDLDDLEREFSRYTLALVDKATISQNQLRNYPSSLQFPSPSKSL